MTHSFDIFITKPDPAEMRVSEPATKSRKNTQTKTQRGTKSIMKNRGRVPTLKKDKSRFQKEKRVREWAEKIVKR